MAKTQPKTFERSLMAKIIHLLPGRRFRGENQSTHHRGYFQSRNHRPPAARCGYDLI
jgi:hypothetical protein